MVSRIITAHAGVDYARWDLPEMELPREEPIGETDTEMESIEENARGGDECEVSPPGEPALDPEELARLRREAREEGFASGYGEGTARGETDVRARIQALEAIVRSLEAPLAVVDDTVESEIVNLVIAISRQLVRRELAADPGQIVAVVRETLSLLPVSHRDVTLHLHPEDAQLVNELLHVDEHDRSWRVHEDPLISRGGCRVVTDSSMVDATVESRLGAAIAQVLGDDRHGRDV